MATTIVPQDASIQTTDDHPTYAEVYSLALELCEAEGLTWANAIAQAAYDLDFYAFYGGQWDRAAFAAGNDDATPF